MSSFLLKENSNFKEKYYHTVLDCGLKIIVIPKSLPTAYAMVCCDFGGADIEYELNGERFSLPPGTAHFLEHKMFENPDGSDAFAEFDRSGGSANAFTSFENTCYYFSCTENFNENLEILLRSVSSVHFTDESIDKERKIIEREITMYDDLPNSNVARNLSRALYVNHPTVYPISGTVETIADITKETLIRAYRDFYVPENLILCVCGDIEPENVMIIAEKYFNIKDHPRPKTVFRDEPSTVASGAVVESAAIATPLYAIGIKCPPAEKNDINEFRKATAMRLAVSLCFGRASDFYCNNYEKGILSERFYAGFSQSRNASHIIISGSGNDPELVMQLAINELETRKHTFFTEEQILREKKAAYAESITLFDLGEDLTAAMASCGFLDYDEYDCIEVLRDITADEVKEALCSLDLSNAAISIINKNEKKGNVQCKE